MKVSELSGALLDMWVARAEGYEIGKPLEPMVSGARLYPFRAPTWKTIGCVLRHKDGTWSKNMPKFSTDWSQGGPIIEREQLAIIPVMGGTRWSAERDLPTGGDDYEVYATYGETPLIAAMRCCIASKFGEEVADEQT